MGYDKKYLLWGMGYAVAGMGLGVFMGASHDHTQHVTHAHILLVGFVTSILYGIVHKLWLDGKTPRVAGLQFMVHQAGAMAMLLGLLLLFGNTLPLALLDPVLGIASIIVLVGAALMLFMVVKSLRALKPG
jgi:hypothetical protein